MIDDYDTYKDSKGNMVRIHTYDTGFDCIAMNMDVPDDRDQGDTCIIATGRDNRAVWAAIKEAGYTYVSN